MDTRISRSTLKGEIDAPSSKSMTHRATILGALATGKTTIKRPLEAQDTLATRNVLKNLGVKWSKSKDWTVHGGGLRVTDPELYCGESGTTLRFITAVSALVEGECILTGGPSLSRRPVGPLVEALTRLGVAATSTNGYPPVKVKGKGKIPGGETILPGDVSSQFISALLIVSPLAERRVTIKTSTPLESRPYVDMTMEAMREFGGTPGGGGDYVTFTAELGHYKPTTYKVEGDWSSAAYLLAGGVLSGDVAVHNLDLNSKQADREIISVIEAMEGRLDIKEDAVRASESGLKALDFDLRNCPDLFPVLSALCSKAEGESRLTGLRRLGIKESDRLQSMILGLKKMGARINKEGDALIIKGGPLRGASVDSYDDHRIAMSFGVLGTVTEGVTVIKNAECVSKSYPDFWKHLESLGAEIGGNLIE